VSEENVNLARRATEAINERDTEALIALTDPSIELHTLVIAATGGAHVYRRHDGVRALRRDRDEVWEELHIEPQAYFDLGEHTLTFGVQRGRGRQSGVQVEMPITIVARWRDGRVVYSKSYPHREEALCDLGVSLDELEPIAP
jgi:ketosteroid isomerase-like protein